MKKLQQIHLFILSSVLFLVLGGYTSTALAENRDGKKVYSIQEVPYTQKDNKYHFVSDPDHYLSNTTIEQINEMCYGIRQKSGAEIAVVVLPWIKPADCFDFAHDLFHHWGIGQKGIDTGLLILVTTEERCAHIYTGYGLEGVLTDITTGNIFRNEMVPYLKNKDWDNGVLAGVTQFYNILYNNEDYEYTKTQMPEESYGIFIVIIMLGLGITFTIVAIVIARRQKKCPKCGKISLQRINSRVINRTAEYITSEETLQCTNCGHTLQRKSKQYRNNHHSGPGAGPIFGGGFGGRGGGSIGGGFGGGRGGGGGAGGRF